MKTDVLIIGGGVTGASIAYLLSKYNIDITIIEKESDICMGTSKANSAMLHSGFNINKSTLKGQLTLQANTVLEELCKDLDVPFIKPLGSITVGFNKMDLDKLKETYEMGITNGIKGVRLLDQEELLKMEPSVNPDAKYGLFEPATGIVDPFNLTLAQMENAVLNGAKVLLEVEAKSFIIQDNRVKGVKTNKGNIEAKVVINAAGIYADKIASMVEDIDFEIKPRKGQYFLYDKKWGSIINHCIYTPKTKVSKGMIIVPTVDGNILAGSNAEDIDDKTDISTTAEGLNEVYEKTIHRILPTLPRGGDVVTTFAGLRPASTNEDFIIDYAKTVGGFINVAGIQSPGLTAAPAIGMKVVELVNNLNYDLDFSPKKNYIKSRNAPKRLANLSYRERDQLIKENPDYGEIVCRCESISKGEIIDAIRGPIPATNIDAVKRRVRAGMGRCQGGFCGPKVLKIISEELGISPTEVKQKGGNSYIITSKYNA